MNFPPTNRFPSPHRLGTLGFLYSDSVQGIKGNQGLWDQNLALEWVQTNIRYFGGNPDQVTIMGNSAGSWSVSAHILSPVSRGLFKNAVMLSGAALPKFIKPKDAFLREQLGSFQKIGCAQPEDTDVTDKVLECLVHKDVDTMSVVSFYTKFSGKTSVGNRFRFLQNFRFPFRFPRLHGGGWRILPREPD